MVITEFKCSSTLIPLRHLIMLFSRPLRRLAFPAIKTQLRLRLHESHFVFGGKNLSSNCPSKILTKLRAYRVPDLMYHLSASSTKLVIIWKPLQAFIFGDRETPAFPMKRARILPRTRDKRFDGIIRVSLVQEIRKPRAISEDRVGISSLCREK